MWGVSVAAITTRVLACTSLKVDIIPLTPLTPPPDATMEGRAVEVACGICGRRGDVEGTVGTVVDTNTPPMINCGGATPAVVAT